MISQGELFLDCIFTDESTFQLGCSTHYNYYEEGNEKARLRSRAKHSAKLHVWGGISSRGTTDIAIFNGKVRMDSKIYCDILEECYLGFSNRVFNGKARLVQDNAPSHKSAYTLKRLDQWGVEAINWPAESPDLNPIELVWGSMKSHMRRVNPRTIADLESEIRTYWKEMTPEICRRYIDGIQWRMPLVVAADGGNIIERNPQGKTRTQKTVEESDDDSDDSDDWF
ncbi:hypothetical protein OESDEN_16419 [Oesophagostomum dentatum]|uniref:Tc1-like transposase DDE domain-containing protein n=1 Tax=Oesophagostomum dentatum TaxID=61180 RepID=A0A0B1SG15_OESDE|nr:hypothetical protein OESDEN_16419 [Oesophagostomum dentatum]